MDIARLLRHLTTTPWRVRRRFPAATLQAIEQAIRRAETVHAGEIRFVVEGALEAGDVLCGVDSRLRAIDLFSQLRVWDTELNNGLLVYLLLADRAVEVVADRGIHERVGAHEWESICRRMEQAFREDRFENGVIEGIEAIARHLAAHFPSAASEPNELPDAPVVL